MFTMDRQKVQLLLIEKGWKIKELAVVAGISQSTCSKTVNGQTSSAPTIKAIADALGVRPSELMLNTSNRFIRIDRPPV